ncbi:MAG: hypothetical protein JXB13_01205 [Phycisphaerae bacterium]|nr:hypothetical protein [Phycisphaerae bacterium]
MPADAKKRASSLIRTVILFSSALAIVGVLFAIVQYSGTDGVTPPPGPATTQPRVVRPPTTRPASGKAISWREGMPGTPEGGKLSIRIYSPDSSVARTEILAREWHPVAGDANEIQVTEPEIRLRTPSGPEIRVTADLAVITGRSVSRNEFDPQRGRLEGHVVLEMDRLSGDARKALPLDEQNAPPDPHRMVRAEVDSLRFDLEASHIETDGPFRADAYEGSIEGTGLSIRYDEVNGRVESLEIQRGERIVLHRMGSSIRIVVPGDASETNTVVPSAAVLPEVAATNPARTPGSESPDADEDGIPFLITEKPHRPPAARPIETYTARFEDGVVVEETRAGVVTSRLVGDTLAFLFDVGEQRRAVAGQTMTPGQPVAAPSAPVGEPDESSEVVLTWTGRFSLDFLVAGAADATGDRMHVQATGNPVRLFSETGEVSCAELEYHKETERVWLRSPAGGDGAHVASSQAGRIGGQDIFFDRLEGVLRVTGPGSLQGRGSAASMLARPATDQSPAAEPEEELSIRFATAMEATFGSDIYESTDPVTGQPVVRKREVLESAFFSGRVEMAQGHDSLAAERVDIEFGLPAPEAAQAAAIQRVSARGGVRLAHGGDSITCDTMDVTMGPDERGAVSPRYARAEGNVVASRGRRRISATDSMIVDLRLYEKPRPPFDLAAARTIAVSRGVDPDTVDWDARRAAYEARPDYEPGLRRMQAFGTVEIQDPKQGLNIAAANVDCSFAPDPQEGGEPRIDKARIAGDPAGSPASVELDDFGIQGRVIHLDAGRQDAEVPGAGRLRFTSRSDLDGRELNEPVPIAITWTQGMTFRGQANRAFFDGAVHGASEDSSLDCDRMVLAFEDLAESDQPAGLDAEEKWWIFAPLIRPEEKDDGFTPSGPRVRRRLVGLSAIGKAIALTGNQDAETGAVLSRARLSSSRIDLDLEGRLVSIEDAGELFIEDYRLRKSRRRGETNQGTNPFGMLGGDEPSQTQMKWGGSMRFDLRYQTASFDRDVELRHKSGAKMVLTDRLLPSQEAREPDKESGRDANLKCQSLFIQFARELADREKTEGRTGIGSLSGFSLDKFQAEGDVYFVDSGISVTATRITYDETHTLLTILGSPARLYDERGGSFRSYQGPRIDWNRRLNLIEASESSIFSR